jgi:hypothetical protein
MAKLISPNGDLLPNYSTNNLFLRSGYVYLNNGKGWRLRFAVLTQDFLSLQLSETSRTSRFEVPLSIITKLERTMIKPFSLWLQYHDHHVNYRRMALAFQNDDELYGWMDDIHAHSPFGCGNPFGFQHKVHVNHGPKGFTGLPLQWETIQTRFPGTLSPTSPVKMKLPLPASPVKMHLPLPKPNRFSVGESIEAEKTSSKFMKARNGPEEVGEMLFQGMFRLKESGSWNSWMWWKKHLILTTEMLVVLKSSRMGKPQKSKLRINLHAITAISRSDVEMHCLLVETNMEGKKLMIAFESDKDLYDWQDAIYLHSSLSGIGYPHNLEHRVHVQFNSHRGEYTGLPRQWKSKLAGTRVSEMIDAHDRYHSRSHSAPLLRTPSQSADIHALIGQYNGHPEVRGHLERRRRILARSKASHKTAHSFSSSISTVVGC